MLVADWKQWAMDMRNWIQGTFELAFEKFVEQKLKDVLNIAVAEPAGWGASMPELNKMKTTCALSVRGTELTRTVFAEARQNMHLSNLIILQVKNKPHFQLQ
jgi:hypothetical protein